MFKNLVSLARWQVSKDFKHVHHQSYISSQKNLEVTFSRVLYLPKCKHNYQQFDSKQDLLSTLLCVQAHLQCTVSNGSFLEWPPF